MLSLLDNGCCKSIENLRLRKNEACNTIFGYHFLANEVIIESDVLCSRMKDKIDSHLKGTHGVAEKLWQFRKKNGNVAISNPC